MFYNVVPTLESVDKTWTSNLLNENYGRLTSQELMLTWTCLTTWYCTKWIRSNTCAGFVSLFVIFDGKLFTALSVGQNINKGRLIWISSLFLNPANCGKNKYTVLILPKSQTTKLIEYISSSTESESHYYILQRKLLTSTSFANSLYPSLLAISI